jgi:alcohol dehydrogenase
MLGAAHALANPLSAHYGTTHGIAVGVMLPHVIRYNAAAVGHLYGELAAEAGLAEAGDPRGASELARFITGLLAKSGQPTDLVACGVQAELLPTLAEEAAAQWTGHFHPRPVDATHLKELYRCALAPSPDVPTSRTA